MVPRAVRDRRPGCPAVRCSKNIVPPRLILVRSGIERRCPEPRRIIVWRNGWELDARAHEVCGTLGGDFSRKFVDGAEPFPKQPFRAENNLLGRRLSSKPNRESLKWWKNLQRGRVMKTTRIFILRSSLFVLATLFVLGSLFLANNNAYAQTAANAQATSAASASTQATSAGLGAPIIKPVARITQKIDETKLVPLHNRVHALARAEFDRGTVADSQPMNRMMLVLQRSPEQQAALSALMDEQQTKNSPNYHAWLTPNAFAQQFGVADPDIQTISNWLTQKGFTGIKTVPGNMFIEFSGTAGLVRSAFHTEIHQFLVKGEMHMANVSVPQIPSALSPVIRAISSLHTFRKKSFMHYSKILEDAKARAAAKGTQFTFADLCPNSPNGNQPCAAVGPGDFAKIYNLPSGLDGTGQTIALVARSNVTVSDINQFGTAFGISNLTNFSYANNVVLTGPDPGTQLGDAGEATLDVEWSGAVAPKANILLVPSDSQASTFSDGVDLSAIYIVANNLAPIMSESFGSCEAENNGLDAVLWEQAAAQGITVMVSTGDAGSASCDPDAFSGNFSDASDAGLTVSGTAATQFNVAVGGTDFDDAANPSTYWNTTNSGTGLASAKSYIPEITWNGGCAGGATAATLNSACSSINPTPADGDSVDVTGGGGGASNCSNNTVNPDGSVTCAAAPTGGTPKPNWQQTPGLTGMPSDQVRDIPDVSLFAAVNTASGHFYIICMADSALQNGQPCSLTGSNLNFSGVGGTSASSPAFAGIIALVNQSEVTAGRLKAGEGQGNVNYVLYKLAASQYANASLNCNSSTVPNAGCTFNDITKGNNSVPCVGSFTTLNPNLFDLFTTPNCSSTTSAVGVLVETSSATTPGWTTTAGYDLATGLGSVNVSNLVANWGNVTTNYKASTATITSTTPANLTSPAISHGSSVTFNVSVTSGSGTPTGDVTLVTGQPLAVTGTIASTLSGGTAQITTDQLPGGTYPVTVHYAGDGTFAASDSNPVTVTISKENSSSQLSMWEFWNFPSSTMLAPPSAPYGSQYLFRVDVIGSQNQDNQICSQATVVIPCPTGKVTFTADGNPLNDFLNTASGTSTNSALLNPQGFVEDRVLGSNGLAAGTHSIGASYAGDNSYAASTATALSITITQAPTQTAVTASSNGNAITSVPTGQPVVLTATVGTLNPTTGGPSSGVGPTGTVTFSSCGSAASCTVPVVPTAGATTGSAAFATATLNTTFATAGNQTTSATYSGDTNYTACTANNNPAGCTLAAATFTVTAPGTVAVSSTPVTLNSTSGAAAGSTITVTPSGGFTGNVVVTATAASLPPGVTCPNSPLTISVTGTTAVQGTLNCQVTAHSATLTASNLLFEPTNRMLDAQATPTAVPGAGSAGKGWLVLSAGTGFAALFLIFIPGGRKRLHAALGLGLVCLLTLTLGCNGVNSGGGGGGGAVATVTKLTVPQATEPSGTAFSFNVSVTGGTPTGMVQLFDGAAAIGTATAVNGGTATPTAPALSVGTHAISAHYLGDTKTLASQSGTLNLTSTGAAQIAITTTPAASPAASPITITVQ